MPSETKSREVWNLIFWIVIQPGMLENDLLEAIRGGRSDQIGFLLQCADESFIAGDAFVNAWITESCDIGVSEIIVVYLCCGKDNVVLKCVDTAIRHNNCDVVQLFVAKFVESNMHVDLKSCFELACQLKRVAIIALFITALPNEAFIHGSRTRFNLDVRDCILTVLIAELHNAVVPYYIQRGVAPRVVYDVMFRAGLKRDRDIQYVRRLIVKYKMSLNQEWFRSVIAYDNSPLLFAYTEHYSYGHTEYEQMLYIACEELAIDTVCELIRRGANNLENALLHLYRSYVYGDKIGTFAPHDMYPALPDAELSRADWQHGLCVDIAYRLVCAGAKNIGVWFHLVAMCRVLTPAIVDKAQRVFETHVIVEDDLSRETLRQLYAHGVMNTARYITVNTQLIELVLDTGLPRSRVAQLHNAASIFKRFDEFNAEARRVLDVYLPSDIAKLTAEYLP